MSRTDALMCLERHATSKILSEDDLFRVATLGFRGEAIPSIASVSKFEILTRPRDAEAGTRIRIEGGKLLEVSPAGAAPGTEVSVGSLFFNLPARRKFLRSVDTELGHCLEAVTREALIRPGLDLEVTDPGPSRATTSGSSSGHGLGGLQERARLVGGTVQYGARGEGFRVHATLPTGATRRGHGEAGVLGSPGLPRRCPRRSARQQHLAPPAPRPRCPPARCRGRPGGGGGGGDEGETAALSPRARGAAAI
jgi:hypothetical protein